MKVIAAYCDNCKTWIYSRARHDFRRCPCDAIAVDGGRDYFKMSFKNIVPRRKEFELDVSAEELYDDWNNSIDKYGVINE